MPKVQGADRITIDVRDLAKVLGVSRELLYGAVRRGELEAIRVGRRRVVIPLKVAEEMLGQKIHLPEFHTGPKTRGA